MFRTGVIPFQESNIFSIKNEKSGDILIAIKPIVEELGLKWESQRLKIINNKRYEHGLYPVLTDGGVQDMTCINAKKLPMFLYSINPNKVKQEHKAKLIAFQDETEWAIYEYWTKGEAKQSDFVSSEAFRQLQEHLFQLELDKRELNAQITNNLQTIGQQSLELDNKERVMRWEYFEFSQTQNTFLSKMKTYASEMYSMGKELEEVASGYGVYQVRKKVDGMAKRLWSSYSDFRDELELLEMQGA